VVGRLLWQSRGVPSGLSEAVAEIVASIPPGRVMTYGDIARFLGCGSPRQIGRLLATCDADLPWHRVVMADGSPPEHLRREHLARLRSEGTRLRGGRVELRSARWTPEIDDTVREALPGGDVTVPPPAIRALLPSSHEQRPPARS